MTRDVEYWLRHPARAAVQAVKYEAAMANMNRWQYIVTRQCLDGAAKVAKEMQVYLRKEVNKTVALT